MIVSGADPTYVGTFHSHTLVLFGELPHRSIKMDDVSAAGHMGISMFVDGHVRCDEQFVTRGGVETLPQPNKDGKIDYRAQGHPLRVLTDTYSMVNSL